MEEAVTSRFRELGAFVQHSLFDSIAYRRGIIECSERHIVYVKWTLFLQQFSSQKPSTLKLQFLKFYVSMLTGRRRSLRAVDRPNCRKILHKRSRIVSGSCVSHCDSSQSPLWRGLCF
jgi:hypothetical protein